MKQMRRKREATARQRKNQTEEDERKKKRVPKRTHQIKSIVPQGGKILRKPTRQIKRERERVLLILPFPRMIRQREQTILNHLKII